MGRFAQLLDEKQVKPVEQAPDRPSRLTGLLAKVSATQPEPSLPPADEVPASQDSSPPPASPQPRSRVAHLLTDKPDTATPAPAEPVDIAASAQAIRDKAGTPEVTETRKKLVGERNAEWMPLGMVPTPKTKRLDKEIKQLDATEKRIRKEVLDPHIKQTKATFEKKREAVRAKYGDAFSLDVQTRNPVTGRSFNAETHKRARELDKELFTVDLQELISNAQAHQATGVRPDIKTSINKLIKGREWAEKLPFSPAGLEKMIEVNSIYKKMNSGGALSEYEQARLDEFAADKKLQQELGQTIGSAIFDGVIDMLPYMAEFAATGGIAGVARGGARAGIKVLGRAGKNKVAQVLVGGTAAATARVAATPQGFGADMIERKLSQLDYDGEKAYKNISRPARSNLQAFLYTFGDRFAEMAGESSGQVIQQLPGATREKLAKYALFKSWRAAHPKAPPGAFVKAMNKLGKQGIVEEWTEERYSAALREIMGVDKDERKDGAGAMAQRLTYSSFQDALVELGVLAVGGGPVTVANAINKGRVDRVRSDYTNITSALDMQDGPALVDKLLSGDLSHDDFMSEVHTALNAKVMGPLSQAGLVMDKATSQDVFEKLMDPAADQEDRDAILSQVASLMNPEQFNAFEQTLAEAQGIAAQVDDPAIQESFTEHENIEMEVRELMRSGMSEQEARDQAEPLADYEQAAYEAYQADNPYEFKLLQIELGDNPRAIMMEAGVYPEDPAMAEERQAIEDEAAAAPAFDPLDALNGDQTADEMNRAIIEAAADGRVVDALPAEETQPEPIDNPPETQQEPIADVNTDVDTPATVQIRRGKTMQSFKKEGDVWVNAESGEPTSNLPLIKKLEDIAANGPIDYEAQDAAKARKKEVEAQITRLVDEDPILSVVRDNGGIKMPARSDFEKYPEEYALIPKRWRATGKSGKFGQALDQMVHEIWPDAVEMTDRKLEDEIVKALVEHEFRARALREGREQTEDEHYEALARRHDHDAQGPEDQQGDLFDDNADELPPLFNNVKPVPERKDKPRAKVPPKKSVKKEAGLKAVVDESNVDQFKKPAAEAYLEELRRLGKMEVTFPEDVARDIEKHTGEKIYYDADSIYLENPGKTDLNEGIDTVALSDIQTGALGPTLKAAAVKGENPVWFTQSDGFTIQMDAKKNFGVEPSDYAKAKAAEYQAATAAGYELTHYRISGLQNIKVFQKNGRILTQAGAAALVDGGKTVQQQPIEQQGVDGKAEQQRDSKRTANGQQVDDLPGNGKKPSQSVLADRLIAVGEMRELDRGKQQYAYTVRDYFPNNQWMGVNDIIIRMRKRHHGGEVENYIINTVAKYRKAGLLDRMWNKDGLPVYAWKGAEVEPGLLTEEELDRQIAEQKGELSGELSGELTAEQKAAQVAEYEGREWYATRDMVEQWRKDKPIPLYENEFKDNDSDRGYARYIDKYFNDLPAYLQEWWMKRPDYTDQETGERISVVEHGVRGTHVFGVREDVELEHEERPPAARPKVPPMKSAQQKNGAYGRVRAGFNIDVDNPQLTPGIIAEYEKTFGNVISSDSFREFFTEQGYNRADPESSRSYRVPSSKLANQLYDRIITDKSQHGNGVVVMSAGGTGSGKSTVGVRYPDAAAVYDSTLTKRESAQRRIDLALENGLDVIVHFVYRSPGMAWKGIANRIAKGGHAIPPDAFAFTHVAARETLDWVIDNYGDRVTVVVDEVNADGQLVENIGVAGLREKPRYTESELLEEINGQGKSDRSDDEKGAPPATDGRPAAGENDHSGNESGGAGDRRQPGSQADSAGSQGAGSEQIAGPEDAGATPAEQRAARRDEERKDEDAELDALWGDLRKLRNRMNLGVDPDVVTIGTKIAAVYIKKGARNFRDFAAAAREKLGEDWEAFKDQLLSFWQGAAMLDDFSDFRDDIEDLTRAQAARVISAVDQEAPAPADSKDETASKDIDIWEGYTDSTREAIESLPDDLKDDALRVLGEIETRLRASESQNGRAPHADNLKKVRGGLTAGAAVIKSQSEKIEKGHKNAQPERLEYGRKLVQDAIETDLSEVQYNPLVVPKEYGERGVSDIMPANAPYSHRTVDEDGIETALVWRPANVLNGKEVTPEYPVYWMARVKTSRGDLIFGSGFTEEEARDKLHANLVAAESSSYENIDKVWTREELDALKATHRLRTIAFARGLRKSSTARKEQLIDDILKQQEVKAAVSGAKADTIPLPELTDDQVKQGFPLHLWVRLTKNPEKITGSEIKDAAGRLGVDWKELRARILGEKIEASEDLRTLSDADLQRRMDLMKNPELSPEQQKWTDDKQPILEGERTDGRKGVGRMEWVRGNGFGQNGLTHFHRAYPTVSLGYALDSKIWVVSVANKLHSMKSKPAAEAAFNEMLKLFPESSPDHKLYEELQNEQIRRQREANEAENKLPKRSKVPTKKSLRGKAKSVDSNQKETGDANGNRNSDRGNDLLDQTPGVVGGRESGAAGDLFEFAGSAQEASGRDGGTGNGGGLFDDLRAGPAETRSGSDSAAGNRVPANEQSGPVEESLVDQESEDIAAFQDDVSANLAPEDRNHRIEPDDKLFTRGDMAKTRSNIKAIQLLRKLEEKDRNPTPNEKKILAQYVGWGGLPNIFDTEKGNQYRWQKDRPWIEKALKNWGEKWFDLHEEVKELLTDEEFAAAARSTLNAHYTASEVIKSMWELAQRLGFKGGRVGEFGAGVGHFIGLQPEDLAKKSDWKAVELDSITGRILKKLYPQADVKVEGLQDVNIASNSLSMVIGNFPFHQDGPYDKRYPKLSLHNYFFVRALDAVKPGGLVISVTSTGALDTLGRAGRQLMEEKADLVGAIRLPNDAFKANAGTDVTTDIVIFRKKDGHPFKHAHPFVEVGQVAGKIPANEYFEAHPEMMLGIPKLGTNMYGNERFELHSDKSANLEELLADAIASLPANIAGAVREAHTDDWKPGARGESSSGKEHSYQIGKDGAVYQVSAGELVKPEWDNNPKLSRGQRAKAYVGLREMVKGLIALETDENAPDAAIESARKELNRVYDAYLRKYGALTDKAKHSYLHDDPEFQLVAAVEETEYKIKLTKDGKKGWIEVARKGQIFSKRVQYPWAEPSQAADLDDAAAISVAYRNHLSIPFMAELLNKTPEQVREEALQNPNFFENPESGAIEERSEYLSGNVRHKLYVAEREAESNPKMQRNVDALKEAQPRDLGIDEIDFTLGGSWIPESVVNAWMREQFGTGTAKFMRSDNPNVHDRWDVSMHGDQPDWSTVDVSADRMIQAALNLTRVTVTRPHPTDRKKRIPDPEATLAAADMQSKLKKSFVEFAKANEKHGAVLAKAYNESHNNHVDREWTVPDRFKVYPGAASEVDGRTFLLRKHQRRAVARILQESVLLSHGVGTGKTAVMTTAAMEMRRIGTAKKPLIVVQNATLEQFGAFIPKLYPGARVLVAGKKDLEKKNRQRFMGRIATGEYDVVVMSHSQFDRLPDDPQRVSMRIREQLAELESAIREQKDRDGKKANVKDLEAAKARLQERLKKLLDRAQDDTVYFEQLGIDAVMMDEAHLYKKNFFITKKQRIKGLDTGSSQKSLSLSLKLEHVREKTGGKNVVLATGTPVTNTLTEIWNMMRYVAPDKMSLWNIGKFDDFASTFTDSVLGLEIDAAGRFKMVERFASYMNVPELSTLFKQIADVVFAEDLDDVKRPPLKGGKPTAIKLDRNKALESYTNYLQQLYEWFEGLDGQQRKEYSYIPLVIFGRARKSTIDMRLIDETLPEDENSKLMRAASEIYERYKQTANDKGTQLAFLDTYRNLKNGKEVFNAWTALKEALVDKGIPASQVAVISDYGTDAKRERLFAEVNQGHVRVLIGSTEKMGIGVNVQERLAALHHVDAPFRPADMEQREGRILRQGNMFGEADMVEQYGGIEIVRYGVEKTLDAGMYQMLERKQKFINQALKGQTERTVSDDDDSEISFAQASAMFSGDPSAMRRVVVDVRLKELQGLENEFQRKKTKLRDEIRWNERSSEQYQQYKDVIDSQAEEFKPDDAHFQSSGKAHWEIEINGKTHAGRAGEVEKPLDKLIKSALNSMAGQIESWNKSAAREIEGHPVAFKINGHDMVMVPWALMQADGKLKESGVYVQSKVSYDLNEANKGRYFHVLTGSLSAGSGSGALMGYRSYVGRVIEHANYENNAEAVRKNKLVEQRAALDVEFEYAKEVQELRIELAALETELKSGGGAGSNQKAASTGDRPEWEYDGRSDNATDIEWSDDDDADTVNEEPVGYSVKSVRVPAKRGKARIPKLEKIAPGEYRLGVFSISHQEGTDWSVSSNDGGNFFRSTVESFEDAKSVARDYYRERSEDDDAGDTVNELAAVYERNQAYNKDQLDFFGEDGFNFDYERREEKLTKEQQSSQEAAERGSSHTLRRATGTVLGNAIASDFRKTGKASLIGQTITSAADLAVAGQVFRNPSFETMRYFFVRKGQVVHETGATSRLPGSSRAFAAKSEVGHTGAGDEWIKLLKETAARVGADSIWFLHNHPSGDVSISKQDAYMTSTYTRELGGLVKGHVVINHKKYGFIPAVSDLTPKAMRDIIISDARDLPTVEGLPNQYTGKLAKVPHKLLGETILSGADLAKIGKRKELLNASGDTFQLVGTTPGGEITGIMSVPAGAVSGKSDVRLLALARQFQRNTGSGRLFATNVPAEIAERFVKGVRTGMFTDVVLAGEYDSMRNRGVNPRTGYADGSDIRRSYVAESGGKYLTAAQTDELIKRLKTTTAQRDTAVEKLETEKKVNRFKLKKQRKQAAEEKKAAVDAEREKKKESLAALRDKYNAKIEELKEAVKQGNRRLRDELKDQRGDINSKIRIVETYIKEKTPAGASDIIRIAAGESRKVLKKVLSAAKPETRQKYLEEAVHRIDVIFEDAERRDFVKYIDDILMNREPVVGKNKVLQGSLMPTQHETLDAIREAWKVRTGWKNLELIDNLKGELESIHRLLATAEGLEPEMIKKQEAAAQRLQTRIWAYETFGDINGGTRQLSDVIAASKELTTLIEQGRALHQIAQQIFRRERDGYRDLAHMTFTGGRGIGTTAISRREKSYDDKFNLFKGLDTFDTMHQSWEWFLDKLSKFDKHTGILGGQITRHFAVLAHKATTKEDAGVRHYQELFHTKLVEIYGTRRKRKLARILAENSHRVKNSGVFLYNDKGQRAEFPLSKNEAYKYWQLWQDESLRKTLQDTTHVQEDTIKEIEAFIGPEVLAWAKWQLEEFYPEYYHTINPVYKQLWYVNMPYHDNYSPVYRHITGRTRDDMDTAQQQQAKASILNMSLKARIENMKDFETIDGDTVLYMHVMNMEHFKAWALPMRMMNGVFRGSEVQEAVQQFHGKAAKHVMNRFLDDFVRGGVDNMMLLRSVDRFRAKYTKAVIGAKLPIFNKQLASIPAYAMDIPLVDFAKGEAAFWRNPVKAFKILMESDMMKDRYKKGHSRDVILALQSSKTPAIKSLAGKRSWADKLMVMTQLGDGAAIIVGGYAAYHYHYNKARKNAASHETAHNKAIREFEILTARTQQAGNVKDLGHLQRGGSVMKLFTMFSTSPISYYRSVSGAVRNAAHGRGSKSEAMKRVIIGHFLLPMVFQFIANGFRWDDEDQLRAAILGSFNKLFIVGEMADALIAAIVSNDIRRASGLSQTPYGDVAQDVVYAVGRLDRELENGTFDMSDMLFVADHIASASSKGLGIPYEGVRNWTEGAAAAALGETDMPIRRMMGYTDYALDPKKDEDESAAGARSARGRTPRRRVPVRRSRH